MPRHTRSARRMCLDRAASGRKRPDQSPPRGGRRWRTVRVRVSPAGAAAGGVAGGGMPNKIETLRPVFISRTCVFMSRGAVPASRSGVFISRTGVFMGRRGVPVGRGAVFISRGAAAGGCGGAGESRGGVFMFRGGAGGSRGGAGGGRRRDAPQRPIAQSPLPTPARGVGARAHARGSDGGRLPPHCRLPNRHRHNPLAMGIGQLAMGQSEARARRPPA